MASFTRVELPPGPQRDLLDILTDLHIKAGEPTAKEISNKIRKLDEQSAISPDTVWRVICGKQLTKWKYIERIIVVLDGQPDAVRPLFEAARTASVAPHRLAAPANGHDTLVEPASTTALIPGEEFKPTPPTAALPPWNAPPRDEVAEALENARVVIERDLRTLEVMAPKWDGRSNLLHEIAAAINEVWQKSAPLRRQRMTVPLTEAVVKRLLVGDVHEIIAHFHNRGYYDLARQFTSAFATIADVRAIKASIPWFRRRDVDLLDTMLRTVAYLRTETVAGFDDIDVAAFTMLMSHVGEAHAYRARLTAAGEQQRARLERPPEHMALDQATATPRVR